MATEKTRKQGIYPTPPRFALKAHEYLRYAVDPSLNGAGNKIYSDYIWWDPCCGTDGALLVDCPSHTTVFASDLDIPSNAVGPFGAERFQFDFLNEKHLPDSVKEKMKTHKKWVFILNPPFSSGTGGQYCPKDEDSRKGISDTYVGSQMREAKMGLATRNVMCQFIYRIVSIIREYELDALIGFFSPAAIINGPGFSEFRKKFWWIDRKCNGAFCFNSKHFPGIKAEWPVIYSVWGEGKMDGFVTAEIVDANASVCSVKIFSEPSQPLSGWPVRPKATVVRPPMNGPISVAKKGILVDRQSPDALASIYADGNDVQHSGSSCYITTGPNPHTGSWSITPENFESSLVLFGFRRLARARWSNWRDQFSQPDITREDYQGMYRDLIVWALFDHKNLVSSVKLEYQGNKYDLRNEFFWSDPSYMLANGEDFGEVSRDLEAFGNPDHEPFVSKWLSENLEQLKFVDTIDLLMKANLLIKQSLPLRKIMPVELQARRWDAGWWQLRNGLDAIGIRCTPSAMKSLNTVEERHIKLGDKLRPYLYSLGVLP